MKFSTKTLGWGQIPGDHYFQLLTTEVLAELPQNAVVLDAGCGQSLLPTYLPIRRRAFAYWGCDPDPQARQNPSLDYFVAGELDGAKFGDQKFDLVMSSYVLEHLSDPLPFFCSARSVLRPGGTFAFLTCNRKHPFCQAVRLVERLHLKSMLRTTYGEASESCWHINAYPAFYRANTMRQIFGLAEKAGFSSGKLFFVPGGWDGYFTKGLRFLPKTYDRYLAAKRKEGHLILVGLFKA
ncbi:MAG: class I SAM-dependent methyltransferase [Verrucomicrobia bacterium]|nr:class I SAM-dependent methyltransferase [Verrucomicrobiota bacterium]